MSVIDDKIAKIEQIIDYTFKDKLLCAEALQMDGGKQYLSVGGMQHNVLKNKNLEAVGDAIIDAVLCKLWYEFRDNQGKPTIIL
jgi:ribonuclease-3